MKICDTCSVEEPTVATIGFFDGVHLGHRCLLDQVKDVAAGMHCASMAVTFRVHPRKVLQADFQPELLTTRDEKLQRLASTGVDYCLLLDFTRQLAALTAYDFMRMLKERCHVEALVIGYDHRFGHNRDEGYDDYCNYGYDLGIRVVRAVPFALPDGLTVSSSVVRRLIGQGDVAGANRCLGYEYTLDGIVVGGYRIGRTIGFPTANIDLTDKDKMLPADGVYAVRVEVDGQAFGGMLNIGCRPTIGVGSGRSIEVNIFGLVSDIYARHIKVMFVEHVRGEHKFSTREELSAQLERDEEQIRRLLEQKK